MEIQTTRPKQAANPAIVLPPSPGYGATSHLQSTLPAHLRTRVIVDSGAGSLTKPWIMLYGKRTTAEKRD
jgi:hypothetical protein